MGHFNLYLFDLILIKKTVLRLSQTYTLKIAENNKAALTKISVVVPPLTFILFLQAFINMQIMSTSVACDVINSFLYADYVGYL